MNFKRGMLIFLIIFIALSPCFEFFDHWEQWGRDPDGELQSRKKVPRWGSSNGITVAPSIPYWITRL